MRIVAFCDQFGKRDSVKLSRNGFLPCEKSWKLAKNRTNERFQILDHLVSVSCVGRKNRLCRKLINMMNYYFSAQGFWSHLRKTWIALIRQSNDPRYSWKKILSYGVLENWTPKGKALSEGPVWDRSLIKDHEIFLEAESGEGTSRAENNNYAGE